MFSRFFFALAAVFSLGGAAPAQAQTTAKDMPVCGASQTSAAAPPSYRQLGAFRPTFYRILDESNPEWPNEPATEPLLTPEGRLIARVGPTFKHQLDIEGSARLRDGRIVNFEEKRNGSWRYLVVRGAPYGIGEDGYKLIPFRTVAVDPKVIKIGAVLFIPALKGIRLPSGEVHDGFVFAHDTGQGIDGDRIDVFVGFEVDVDNTLTRSGRIVNKQPTCVYQVDDVTAARVRRRFRGQYEAR
ncbi:MAG TPA: 3D domain-containing protein [Pyrinomonadaceae bacterium]|jgi:3D (Asp-Asp-Asp) domain-containing protein|nr:3D domain-containing protein [Pyrinomonadaceae bacterium]